MRVKDVMTSDVVTARPEMTLKDAAREMAAHSISGMPVVDDEKRVIGVISEADLVAKQRHEPNEQHGVLRHLVHRGVPDVERRFEARDVAEAMTAPAVTVPAYCPLAGAAERMLEGRINRYRSSTAASSSASSLALTWSVPSCDATTSWQPTSGKRSRFRRSCGPTAGRSRSAWRRRGHAHGRGLAARDGGHAPAAGPGDPGVVSVRSELTWSEEDSRDVAGPRVARGLRTVARVARRAPPRARRAAVGPRGRCRARPAVGEGAAGVRSTRRICAPTSSGSASAAVLPERCAGGRAQPGPRRVRDTRSIPPGLRRSTWPGTRRRRRGDGTSRPRSHRRRCASLRRPLARVRHRPRARSRVRRSPAPLGRSARAPRASCGRVG